MNILHLAPYFPSINALHAGGVCMGQEINELRKTHNVYSLSFIQKKYDEHLFNKEKTNFDVAESINKVDKICRVISHPKIAPYFATRTSRNFFNLIKRYIDTYNINAIHAEYTSMCQYVKIKKTYPHIMFNVVLHDITYQSFERQVQIESSGIKRSILNCVLGKVKRNEYAWLSQADKIFVFSQKDKELVENLYGLNNVFRINTYFDIQNKIELYKQIKKINNEYFDVAFMGQMERKENVDAALRLIEICEKSNLRNKNIRIHIIGNSPPKCLFDNANDNIIITGYVEDIDKYLLENIDCAVFPLNVGAGIKIKVLTCMALGIPTITNIIGAEGIDECGEFLYLADTNDDFAQRINNLIESGIDKVKMDSAIKYLENNFSWATTANVFSNIYG